MDYSPVPFLLNYISVFGLILLRLILSVFGSVW